MRGMTSCINGPGRFAKAGAITTTPNYRLRTDRAGLAPFVLARNRNKMTGSWKDGSARSSDASRPGRAAPFFLTRRSVIAGGSASVLAACTVGPDFEKPTTELPDRFSASPNAPAPRLYGEKWWHNFNDSTLNEVIEHGLRQNLDIRQSLARIEQAQALAMSAGYPISGANRVSEATFSDDGEVQTLGAFARIEPSWKLDLWGEFRREREAVGYRIDAAYSDTDVARNVFVADVASAYVDLRYSQERLRIAKRIADSRARTLEVVRQKASEGQAGDLEIAQA